MEAWKNGSFLNMPNANSNRSNDSLGTSDFKCLLPLHVGTAMVCINIAMGIIGTIGNLLVVSAVYFTQQLRTVSNMFICSLALADLLVTMCGQPLLAALQLGRTNAQCLEDIEFVFRLVGNFSCAVSFLNLGFVSIDRCVAILKPLRYKNLVTVAKLKAMLAVVWLLPVIYTILRLTINKRATSYFTVLMFAVGYVTILICYSTIFITVWKQANRRQRLQSRTESSHKHDGEKRLAKTLGLVIGVFTVAWVPLFYLRMSAPGKNYGTAYNWARTVAMSSSAVNPVIYCFRNELYRRAFMNILCLRCSDARVRQLGSQRSASTFGSKRRSKSTSSAKAVQAL